MNEIHLWDSRRDSGPWALVVVGESVIRMRKKDADALEERAWRIRDLALDEVRSGATR